MFWAEVSLWEPNMSAFRWVFHKNSLYNNDVIFNGKIKMEEFIINSNERIHSAQTKLIIYTNF